MDYKESFISKKVEEWVSQIKMLAKFAATDPHSAYESFISVLRHKFTFNMRTVPDISSLLIPVEDAIRNQLIPALMEGRSVTDDERLLLSLPPRLGGIGIVNPTSLSYLEYDQNHLLKHYVKSKGRIWFSYEIFI